MSTDNNDKNKTTALQKILALPSPWFRVTNQLNQISMGGVFTGMFVILKKVMADTLLQKVFFSLSAAFSGISGLLEAFAFSKLANPNIHQIFKLTTNLAISAATIATVIATFAFGATVAPYVFFAISAFDSLRSASSCVYNAYQALRSPKGSEGRAFYAKKALNALVGFIVNSVVTVAIGTALAFHAPLNVAYGCVAAGAVVVGLNTLFNLGGLIKTLFGFRKPSKKATISPVVAEEQDDTSLALADDNKNQAKFQAKAERKNTSTSQMQQNLSLIGNEEELQKITPSKKFNYDVHGQINASNFQQYHYLDVIVALSDKNDKKDFLLGLIKQKITELNTDIAKKDWFNLKQTEKREQKCKALTLLQEFIKHATFKDGLLVTGETNVTFEQLVERVQHDYKKSFYSYWRDDELGSVQSLFAIAAKYVVDNQAQVTSSLAATEDGEKKLTVKDQYFSGSILKL